MEVPSNMKQIDNTSADIYARLDPSPFRRWVAVVITGGVGVVLIYLVASRPLGTPVETALVVAAGGVFLWIAFFIHKSTSQSVLPTTDGLFLEDGRVLAEITNIEKVDRGLMAFKPSNGFAVKLKTAGTKGWSPGIWWCAGRNMGIGGATSRDQARQMADTLNVLLSGGTPDR